MPCHTAILSAHMSPTNQSSSPRSGRSCGVCGLMYKRRLGKNNFVQSIPTRALASHPFICLHHDPQLTVKANAGACHFLAQTVTTFIADITDVLASRTLHIASGKRFFHYHIEARAHNHVLDCLVSIFRDAVQAITLAPRMSLQLPLVRGLLSGTCKFTTRLWLPFVR